MNISLSSTNTSQTTHTNGVVMNDLTNLVINLSGVSENYLPTFLSINWGDGITQSFDNDIIEYGNNIENKYSSIFFEKFEHTYYPSDISVYQKLTATCTVNYCNNDISTFVIPISVRNYSYTESVGDMKLISTILRNDKKIHQFITMDGSLVELETPIS